MMAVPTLGRARGLAPRAPGLVGLELPCVALADWLFWGHGIGLSLVLFCVAVAALALLVGRRRIGVGRRASAVVVLLVGVAPMVEDLNPLSVAFGLAAMLATAEVGRSRAAAGWPARIRGAMATLVRGPWQIAADLLRRRQQARRRGRLLARRGPSWLAWVVPAAMTSLFVALFADANPLIAAWLGDIPRPSSDPAMLLRALFWLIVLAAVWPLTRARRRRPSEAAPRIAPDPPVPPILPPGIAAAMLAPAAILRSLVLFNLLFALQLILDGAYLWGGLALPDGMSCATYAHRGAYPLVATALLAGGFVLAARRPDGSATPRLMQALLLSFIGQNIVLVASAMRRLALYVDAYSLTAWRVAAFVWMLLVAIGLVLMVLQGVLRRGNGWLLSRGLLATTTVLFCCCFLDVPSLIASYNVDHCVERRGTGPALDVDTLLRLGPAAIPALDRYLVGLAPDMRRDAMTRWRARAAARVRLKTLDWREWSFRNWRLARYLDRSGTAEPAATAQPGGDDR